MEYPNLIMLDRSLYSGVNLNWLELVTAHETAHQWWCGLVGNDQINNSWMDEALTEYSTVLYYGLIYDSKKEMEVYNSLIGEGKYNLYKALMDTLDKDETIHKPVYEFSSLYTYDALVYGKGAMMFHQLRQELGDELFFDAL